MRRTKEQLRGARNEKRINDLIVNLKYLADSKFYKTNRWSMAACDSWAAQGKAGSCACGCGYYNGTLYNKRKNTEKGGRKAFLRDVGPKLCHSCIKMVTDKLNVDFKRF